MGHKSESPLLPHLPARDGNGNEAYGNAKVEGEAQGKAKGKATTKAKAKPKAEAEAQGGEEIDASPILGEPRVEGPRSDEPQKDSEGPQAEGLAQTNAQAEVK